MKVLSIVVPIYNVEKYLKRCLDSICVSEVLSDIEVILVNDGSKDNSIKIMKEYEKKYPNTIILIDKENGGHGSAVNAGIEHASGLYFKVVDSDDWVSQSAYMQILNRLKELLESGSFIDMFISNFVYEKEGEKHKKVMKYHQNLLFR